MPKPLVWVPEAEAAKMLLYKRPKTLREKVRAGVLPIHYTHDNCRRYQYLKEDIERYLFTNSNIIKK